MAHTLLALLSNREFAISSEQIAQEVKMYRKSLFMLVFISVLSLALGACGYSKSDRALSGAGIGAGVGAAGSAVTGGDPVTGAVIGAGVGAATGALTDPDEINLDHID